MFTGTLTFAHVALFVVSGGVGWWVSARGRERKERARLDLVRLISGRD